MNQQITRLKILIAGIFSLILMVGIARFAYTPMLPIMQLEAGLSVSGGGWLAAINYCGYLSGAILASLIADLGLKWKLYRWGLVLAIITTVAMGMTTDFWLWAVLRFVAGLSSAAAMLLGSGLILNWLIRHGHRSELGIHFSGLGLGIVVCSLAVELMQANGSLSSLGFSGFSWDMQWYLLAVLGLILLIPAWIWLPKPSQYPAPQNAQDLHDNPPSKTFMRIFIVAYFCAGVGYVVSATFIVAIVERLPEISQMGNWVFLALGLGAAPACIVWDLIARRIGELNALISASILQIIGILLPIIQPNLFFALAGALLFGGTFIGIVSLVLTMAGKYYPSKPAKMMGKMTIGYGMAQILAPAVTGILADSSGSYYSGLYLAATMMGIAAVLMALLKKYE